MQAGQLAQPAVYGRRARVRGGGRKRGGQSRVAWFASGAQVARLVLAGVRRGFSAPGQQLKGREPLPSVSVEGTRNWACAPLCVLGSAWHALARPSNRRGPWPPKVCAVQGAAWRRAASAAAAAAQAHPSRFTQTTHTHTQEHSVYEHTRHTRTRECMGAMRAGSSSAQEAWESLDALPAAKPGSPCRRWPHACCCPRKNTALPHAQVLCGQTGGA